MSCGTPHCHDETTVDFGCRRLNKYVQICAFPSAFKGLSFLKGWFSQNISRHFRDFSRHSTMSTCSEGKHLPDLGYPINPQVAMIKLFIESIPFRKLTSNWTNHHLITSKQETTMDFHGWCSLGRFGNPWATKFLRPPAWTSDFAATRSHQRLRWQVFDLTWRAIRCYKML